MCDMDLISRKKAVLKILIHFCSEASLSVFSKSKNKFGNENEETCHFSCSDFHTKF